MTIELTQEFKDKYVIDIEGKDFVLYAGLQHLAQEQAIIQEEIVQLVQAPNDDNGNMAIISCTIKRSDGRVFSAIGDCDDTNCTKMIAPHKIRMAQTRASGIALRKALGINILMSEEMTSTFDDKPITQPQVTLITKLMIDKALTKEETKSIFTTLTGKSELSMATKKEASNFIDYLMNITGSGPKSAKKKASGVIIEPSTQEEIAS